MSEVYFYHLTRPGRAETLLTLTEKTVAQGWRLMLRGGSAEARDQLDDLLWTAREDSFLPHARAGGPQEAGQPVVLAPAGAESTGYAALICWGGEGVSAAEVAGLTRASVVFLGNDEAELTLARGLWKALAEEGVSAAYWSEETGRWARKA